MDGKKKCEIRNFGVSKTLFEMLNVIQINETRRFEASIEKRNARGCR